MNSFRASSLAALALLVYCNLASSSEIESRPAMGHMARLPGGQGDGLYREYFRIFLLGTLDEAYDLKQDWREETPKLDDHDWRNYSPTSYFCVDLLRDFVNADYKLDNYVDLIHLDACLGYLYDDNQYKFTDPESPLQAKIIESLLGNENLKKIYTGTQIETWNPESLKFVLEMLKTGFERSAFSLSLCDDRIEVLTKYAQDRKVLDNLSEDSYVKILDDSARRMGQRCYSELLKKLAQAYPYTKHGISMVPNPINLLPLPARKQRHREHWTENSMKILQKSMGLSSLAAVDLDNAQSFAHELKTNDPKAQQQLLTNLSNYANKKFGHLSKSENEGVAKSNYLSLKKRLCENFMPRVLEILIQMLPQREFFGDLESVLYDFPEKEFAPKVRITYLTNFLCRYIDLTDATTTATNNYAVHLAADPAVALQIWPMAAPSHRPE